MSTTTDTRYAVVSSDGHAGADLYDYKAYLPSSWHDDFDAWAPTYVNPYADLQAAYCHATLNDRAGQNARAGAALEKADAGMRTAGS